MNIVVKNQWQNKPSRSQRVSVELEVFNLIILQSAWRGHILVSQKEGRVTCARRGEYEDAARAEQCALP